MFVSVRKFLRRVVMMKKTGFVLLAALAVSVLFPAALASDEPNQRPGFYTGTAQGFDGEVSVTLEIRDKVIVSVTAVGDHETMGIGTLALDNMPGMMVRANSIEVDVVSGATVSSQAILQAAAKALEKAGLTKADLIRR
jgi:fumarate reductase flavoprotein subunit